MPSSLRPLALAIACASLTLLAVTGAAGSTRSVAGEQWNFFSAPTLHPPKIRADRPLTGRLAPGYFMLANTKDLVFRRPLVGQGGPLILDSHLQPVWFYPIPLTVSRRDGMEVGANAVFNLREQTYEGQPVLSWWQGAVTNTGATLNGKDIVVNQHYQPIATLVAQGPPGCTGAACWVISEHEFLIEGHDAWVTAYRNVAMDLTPYGGPRHGTVIDSAVQEYDLRTGKQLFSWDALAHVPLSESHARPLSNGFWDAYHENSISLGRGSFVVSMRNDWAAYDVSEASGRIRWTLSGDPRLSSFKVPPGARFQWQHDVELHPNAVVSVFDDHCCNVVGAGRLAPPTGPASRGLLLKLNFAAHTAALLGRYVRARNYYVPFLGNAQLLPGGNVVVGWGSGPNFSEFTRSGSLLFDAAIPDPDLSYRAYVQKWVGLPLYPPSGAARRSGGRTTVYASWNGATRVVAWRVLAGPSAGRLRVLVRRAPKLGFETAIAVPGSPRYFEAQALAANGRPIGTSKPFSVPQPALVGAY